MTIRVTPAMLRALSPKENPKLIGPIADAMNEFFPNPLFDITTELRVENFLCQALIETDYFKTLVEYASGDAYDTRTDLGNTPRRDGDGRKNKGRGIFMLTGAANYKAMQKRLKDLFGMVVDLVNHPELAAQPRLSVLIACIYWKDKGLNALADRDDTRGITKKINGGYNALKERLAAREKCRPLIKSADPTNDTIGPGSDHDAILALQKLLTEKKYQPGRIDGKWGKMTRDAVLALKADNGLDTSHETITFAEAAAAPDRALEMREDATVADLRAEGSNTIKSADNTQIAGGVGIAGTMLGVGGQYLDKAEAASGTWSRIKWILEPFQDFLPFITNNLWIIVPTAAVVGIYIAHRVKQKRLEEFKAGKVQ